MATETQSPGTAATSDDLGDADWADPSNSLADDNSFATVFLDATEGPLSSYYLVLTNFDFSAIPVGATIDGMAVTARVKGSSSLNVTIGSTDFFRNSDSTWYDAANEQLTTALTTTETEYSAGGATDLCLTTWTRDDILSANYGVRFNASNIGAGESGTISIDLVTVTVYYTAGGGGGAASSMLGLLGVG